MNKDIITQAEKTKQKLQEKREFQLIKKEMQLNKLSDEEIMNELKQKGLATFGTRTEKLERLKRHYGITGNNVQQSMDMTGENSSQNTNNTSNNNGPRKILPKSSVVDEIEKLKQRREERRMRMEEIKREKAEREAENEALGKLGDVEFDAMIEASRFKQPLLQRHTPASNLRLCVCVRKRPIFQKELLNGEIDAVSCANPQIMVHECKYKVDGITKYVENHAFTFDNTFNQDETNYDVYNYSISPHVDFLMNQGIVTCFAYGQTGSGKTYTMRGVQELVIQDLFKAANTKYRSLNLRFGVSFYEIYGGRCYDLLNNKNQLAILEDKNQEVQIQGLEERIASTPEEMNSLIEYGNSVRTTHQTVANDTSSRSHAICQIVIRDPYDRVQGKLLLVDLAGSERAQDTQSNNRARRIEGAEINKSLLALKECIRAMDSNKQGGNNHIPFRASKLTLVLRDSFTSKNDKTRIVMIACICPGSSSADHSLNTIRYADRLKEKSNAPIKPEYIPEDYLYDRKEDSKVQNDRKPLITIQQNPFKYTPPPKSPTTQLGPNDLFAQKPMQSAKVQSTTENFDVNVYTAASVRVGLNDHSPLISSGKINKKTPPSLSKQNSLVEKNNSNGKQKTPPNQTLNQSENKEEESPIRAKKANADIKFMKESIKLENNNRVSNEYFDFQAKVNSILEEQEEIFNTHMSAIKEDARLLTNESELISTAQNGGVANDIDGYIDKLEAIVKTKLQIYSILDKKITKFRKLLKEEEEMSHNIKETVYY